MDHKSKRLYISFNFSTYSPSPCRVAPATFLILFTWFFLTVGNSSNLLRDLQLYEHDILRSQGIHINFKRSNCGTHLPFTSFDYIAKKLRKYNEGVKGACFPNKTSLVDWRIFYYKLEFLRYFMQFCFWTLNSWTTMKFFDSLVNTYIPRAQGETWVMEGRKQICTAADASLCSFWNFSLSKTLHWYLRPSPSSIAMVFSIPSKNLYTANT